MAPMTKLALFLALLTSDALAAPQYNSYKHVHLHKRATGTGSGYPHVSGAPYGPSNHTHHHSGSGTGHHHSHTGTGTGSGAYSTLTVVPLPAYPSDTAAESTAAAYTGAPAPPANDNAAGNDSTCTDESTVYVTASNTVTVTVAGDSSAAATSGAAESAYPSAYASSSAAPYGQGNSTVWDGPTGFPTYGTGVAPSTTLIRFTSPMVSPQPFTTVPVAAPSSPTAAASSTTSTTAPTTPASSPPPAYAPPPPPPSTTPVLSTAAAVPASSSTSPTTVVYKPQANPVKPQVSTLSTLTTATTKATTATTKSAAPTTTPATPVSGGSSGSGRGLVYNTASLCAPFESSTAISWAYNWGSSSGGLASSLEFVPMLWGMNGAQYDFLTNAEAAIAAGSKHVMAFNEPDLSSQSNLSPSVAATNYQKYMMPLKGKALLGAPAVTNANKTSPAMGVPWLDQFNSACAGACQVDFVPMHWYGWSPATAQQQAHAFQDYFTIASARVQQIFGPGTKIWVTEFAALPLDDQALNSAFLEAVLPWLDGAGSSMIERYSYFMVTDGSLVNGGSLTEIGSAYLTTS